MSSTPSFNALFAESRAALNDAQREAVQHIEGATLVIAGPGTGKTHILATRIGEILTKTDAQPYNILCLTFTDAGVRAMRERLAALIGAAAHKVRIQTFHGFCNRVIQDNLDMFGRQDLTALDELERRQLIRTLLDELPFEHILKKGRGSDVYFYEKHLADLFKLMKTEAWTQPFVARAIDEYLQDLPENNDFKYKISKKGLFEKGDLKTETIEAETERMERLRAASQLYIRYEVLKTAANRYDFDDMIIWVIEAFERLPFLLRGFQEQFLYFLIDEFQDTNGAQNRLLGQLIDFWQQPNIFIVGDDDQAIYEFQGARLKSLLDFHATYSPDVKVVVLKNNYRSSQHILDAAANIVDNNKLRIVNNLNDIKFDKKLTAFHKKETTDILPKIIEYPNRFQELTDIVAQIETLKSQNIPLSNTAIIYARHRAAEPFLKLFEKKGIPYSVRRAINILDEPIIQNLRLLLQYIQLEANQYLSGEYLMFKILNINFLNINKNFTLKITKNIFIANNTDTTAHIPNINNIVNDNAALNVQNTVFTEGGYFASKNWRTELGKHTGTAAFSKKLDAWIQAVGNEALPVLIEKIINQSGLLSWVLNDVDKIKNTQLIDIFFSFVQREIDKKPRLSLSELLNTLDLMDANNIRLELVNFWSQNTEGVVLTTAHAAKGLEFDRVFIIDALETEWEEAKTGGSMSRFKLPPTLTFTAQTDDTEARRRLFYVAATRARTYLQVSYAQTDERGKSLQRSLFVEEMLAKSTFETRQSRENTLLETQTTLLTEGSRLPKELFERDFIQETLKDFSLSISALNSYVDCPLQFYFEYILKIPSQPSAAFQYGEAVHVALRRLFAEMLRSKEKMFPKREDFIQYFETDFTRRQPLLEPPEFQQRWKIGRENLYKYYSHINDTFSKNVVVEKSVFAEINQVPVRGVIDQIVFNADGTAHIIDFKTGKINDDRIRKPTVKNPFGGIYWRQLVFYKLLYENFRSHLIRIPTGEITWVEADAKGNFKSKKLDLTGKDVEIVRDLIANVWSRIQKHDFDGCGKTTCHWCRFVNNNFVNDSFRNEDTEALDD